MTVSIHASALLLSLLVFSCCKSIKQNEAEDPPATKPTQGVPSSDLPSESKSFFSKAPDGTKIHYVVLGAGSPIVLIHGYMADAESNWFRNGIAQEIAKTNQVIAIDVRGHGKSDAPTEVDFYGQNMWQDVYRIVTELKITKAQFHGYSMGGSIVAQLLYHHPEIFSSAIFGGSGIPEVDSIRQAGGPTDASGRDPQEDSARSDLLTTVKRNSAAMAAVAKNAPWDGPELRTIDLPAIQIPVLALNGEFDSPIAKTSRMKRELKNFNAVVLKGKSHLTTIGPGYMPELYKITLVNFIKRN